jgi:hypothetical protein
MNHQPFYDRNSHCLHLHMSRIQQGLLTFLAVILEDYSLGEGRHVVILPALMRRWLALSLVVQIAVSQKDR